MRNISFSLTTPQFIAGTKWVTRRNGWLFAKASDHLMGIEKGMGLAKGEKVKLLGEIEVVSARREPLDMMHHEPNACAAEGFPDWSVDQFIDFYCKANKCKPADEVTRIEFKKVEAN
jgi:hypothetical protein